MLDFRLRAVYLARGILDYRVPVLVELDRLCGGNLTVFYSADYVAQRVARKLANGLGGRAVGLEGEYRLGPELRDYHGFSNRTMRVSYQPGLMRAVARTRPDVMIGEGFFQWTAFALLRRAVRGTPLVVSYERTAHTDRNAQWYRRAYWKAVLPRVDAMVCNGSLAKAHAVSLGMPAQRIATGQMAADSAGLARIVASLHAEERAEIRKRWGAPERVFLYAGKLNVPKGVWELLRAWNALPEAQHARTALVLVGDGPERAGLQGLAAARGLSNVFFEGNVDYDLMGRFYGSADLFVMPTLEDNWSLVVAEAMACGLPILCSRYNGCYPELIDPGQNGWVFDPLSPDDAVRALTRVADASVDLRRMGERSLVIIADYSPERAAAAMHSACLLAIDHGRGRRR